MKPLHIAAIGAILLVAPIVISLVEMLWLPLGVMLLVVGVVLHLVQKHHQGRMGRLRP
ncbi:hypothetical protein SAMN04487949_1580 [Halogranum gelatinilyticum]|uniref:Uncharacterized protein n=1 Tax=Halogranum gelatinilyticum TaxID=660521 RepID=A0A1G9T128_9EURY|nr:hypothetical protein [Halogranum gelatinilyticum]SDM41443.1 hypothetical protein SAMN04487949_1580 [Halogranum gelatinilyticum]